MTKVHNSGFGLLPPVIKARPMLMLTGFLGAGKTTLLRSLLDHLTTHEHLADVILNDIENARIDRDTLRDHAASVAALTGSCVCCEGMDLLYDMILKASKTKHSVLLIELNGTADPIPLHETFTLMESSFRLHPRWQVCVIDARYFGQRSAFRELEKLQLETASHYYIAHTSNSKAQNLEQLEEDIQNINPLASRTTASDLATSLGKAIKQNRRHVLAKPKPNPGSKTAPLFNNLRPKENHHHDRHQLAHQFTGCNIVFPKPVDPSRVNSWLQKLPPSVVRVKALVTLTTDPGCRFLYERVGMEISPSPLPVRIIDTVPCSGLFIGPDLQPEEVLQTTLESLHPDCHFPTQ